MTLTYFPVTAILKAAVSDTSTDPDGDPDIQFVSSFVYFAPSEAQVYDPTDATIYRLTTIKARTNPSDGALKNIDGSTVHLVANTPTLEDLQGNIIETLTYEVTFDHTVYGEANQEIQPFRFLAPVDATPVDLASVERLPA